MRLYAQLPARRARQLTADLLLAVWAAVAAGTGVAVGIGLWTVGDRAGGLAGRTRSAAGQLSSSGDSLSSVPLVGGQLAGPLHTLAASLTALGVNLGGDTTTLHRAGIGFGVTTDVLALAVPVLVWASTRGRWVRAVRGLRGPITEDDLEVLATTAVTTAGLRVLHQLPPQTVLAWRAGDPAARRALAAIGSRSLGLHPPTDPGRVDFRSR